MPLILFEPIIRTFKAAYDESASEDQGGEKRVWTETSATFLLLDFLPRPDEVRA